MNVIADRVKEVTTSAGTTVFALDGSEGAFIRFNQVCSVGDVVYYCAAERTGNNWEVGKAEYTSTNLLTRITVLASSNSNSSVDFGAGIKDVFLTTPAAVIGVLTELNQDTILGRTMGNGVAQQLTPSQVSSLLISSQSNNRLNTGSDGKLFVPELTIDLVSYYNDAKA